MKKVRAIEDPQEASKFLVDYALRKGSQDNVTVLVVRFQHVPSDAHATSDGASSDMSDS